MVVAIAVGGTFFGGVYLVEPVVGNHLTGGVVHKTGVGVSGVRVGLDTPVGVAHIFLDGLLTVYPGVALVETGNLLTLQLVQETVFDEVAGRVVGAGTHQFLFDAVLHHFHGQVFFVLQFIQHIGIDKRIVLLL